MGRPVVDHLDLEGGGNPVEYLGVLIPTEPGVGECFSFSELSFYLTKAYSAPFLHFIAHLHPLHSSIHI